MRRRSWKKLSKTLLKPNMSIWKRRIMGTSSKALKGTFPLFRHLQALFRFLHFRFSSQNRKTRVRPKDRIFSRSSVTCPLPGEEDAPFQTPPQTVEALVAALSGSREMTSIDMPLNLPEEKPVAAATAGRRRRNTVTGSEGTITAPLTPRAVKADEPMTGGPAKRVTRRRK